jgi:FMN-dependent NADH-azoreductase
MSSLLYIESSPLKPRSHSIDAARAFLDAYATAHPGDRIDEIDLWKESLPPFDAETIEAKFAVLRGQQFTAEQLARWEAVRAVSRRFNAADKYVFSVPMWNFHVPYPLKHYIDVVTLPGENWTWSRADGYGTIWNHKKALLVVASANRYGDGDGDGDDGGAGGDPASDFQRPYLRRWLGFIGITDVHEIAIAPTLADPAALAETRSRARSEAARLAATF